MLHELQYILSKVKRRSQKQITDKKRGQENILGNQQKAKLELIFFHDNA